MFRARPSKSGKRLHAVVVREARRLFYVGLTRAKHEVHMTFSGFTMDGYQRQHQDGPSEFLLEIQMKLAESDAAESVPF